jgi:hypothetical protein
MNTTTNYAALYLSKIPKDQQELENIVNDYPVSSAARFLLLYQLKKNNDARFNEVAKQTGIYLQNPAWMEFQLADVSTANPGNLENNFAEEELPAPVNEPASSADREIIENPVLENENGEIEISNSNEEVIEKSEESPEQVNESVLSADREIIENAVLENENNEIEVSNSNEEVAVEKSEESSQPVNDGIIENPVLENENDEIEISNSNEEVAVEKSEEELSQPVNEEIIENPVLENENHEIEISNSNEEAAVEKSEESPQPVNEEIIEIPVLENENGEIEISNSNEEVIIKKSEESTQPANEEIIENPDLEEENISFEPLHTVDYFASQGIKLSEEALNNDQLGKQVKSFTAWLKSMKKLHPGQLPEQNEVIEKLIQTSSEASNKNANVLTEAMAEVLLKQGKREKAVEMYQKLSLLNPSKSAYFAAKIESLKII